MTARTYGIIGKQREGPFDLADIKDFHLRQTEQVCTDEILVNPDITLYSLDFENSQAIFVELPAEIDMSQTPFYFITF